MFFRRQRPVAPSFEDKLERLRALGLAPERQPDGRVRAARGECAAVFSAAGIERAGLVVRGEIAALVDGGYQKCWLTPDGSREPALAGQLQALHTFEEDLREGLGLESLYNMSLGTTNNLHRYDRLRGRG